MQICWKDAGEEKDRQHIICREAICAQKEAAEGFESSLNLHRFLCTLPKMNQGSNHQALADLAMATYCFPIKCFSISPGNYCSRVRGSSTDRDLPTTALVHSLGYQCQPCFVHDLSQDTKVLSAGCRSTATHFLLLPRLQSG